MPAFGFVTNSKKELLLIQRGYGNRKGKWSLPGGNRDRGESHRRAAIRETKEETGIRLHHPYLFLKGKRHRYEIWRGKKAGGNIRYQRKECLDAKWFPVNMLPHDDCLAFDPDKKAIGQYANEHSRSRRVQYPRRKMKRAGYLLIIDSNTEILLRRKTSGKRKGAFTLPGQNARKGGSRKSAALSACRCLGIPSTLTAERKATVLIVKVWERSDPSERRSWPWC